MEVVNSEETQAMAIQNSIDGISSTIHIVVGGRAPQEVTIRHYQLDYFILEGGRYDFRHNEMVTAYFNYILDGKVNFVRLTGQIKIDRLYGVRLVYEQSSILREIGRRLHSARRYNKPCSHLACQPTRNAPELATGNIAKRQLQHWV